jgi:cytochrome oxidase Cu insertion factor (SCO1/SenC/PrrC family)
MTLKEKGIANRTKKGEAIPNFIVKDVLGNNLSAKKWKGKPILIKFGMSLNFEKATDPQKKLNYLLEDFKDSKKLKALVFLPDEKASILNKFDAIDLDYHLVANAENFSRRYLVFRKPSFMLVDQKGNLVGYFDTDEMPDLYKAIQGL